MAVDTAATVVRVRAVVEGLPGLNQLKTAMRGISAESKSAGVDLRIVNDQLKSLKGEVNNSVNNLRLQVQAFQAVRNSAQIGSQAYRDATLRLKELNRELDKAEGRGAGGGRLASLGAIASAGFFGGPESMVGAGIGALFGPQGAFAGAAIGAQVAQIRQQITNATEYSQQLAKLRLALRGVVESTEEYNRALQAVESISSNLNVPIVEATQGFTRLTAAVIGAGGNVSDAERVFRGVTSAIKATGGSAADVQGALVAMSQVFSKGKLSAEELQGQLGERLPGAVTLFAQATGRSLPQLSKDLEQGIVSLNDVMKFSDELANKYSANAQTMARSSEESSARTKVALEKLGIAFGEFFKPVKVGIDNIIAGFANMVTKAIQSIQLVRMGLKLTSQEEEDIRKTARQIAAQRYPKNILRQMYETPGIEQSLIFDRLQLKGFMANVLPTPETQRPGTVFQEPKPDGKDARGRKVPVQRLADLINASEAQNDLLTKQLRLEELIENAKKNGYTYDLQVLPLLAGALRATSQLAKAEEKIDDLKKNKAAILKAGMPLEEYLTRLGVAQIDADTARKDLKREYVVLRRQEFDISKQIFDAEVKARHEIGVAIAEAQLKGKQLSEEDQKRVQINQYLSQVIEKYAGILKSEELLDAIRKIREAMEGTAKATGSFGEKIAKSFAEVVKSSGDLASNLGASLGNAFIGLGDQLADFVTTGKMQFADFARSVLNDLTKIFIRAALFQTLKALIPGGSGLAKAFGFASGGIMTQKGPLQLRRYASGGIAYGPQLAMYGEGSRPEAYVPLPDGRTIPVTMKGGGANVVVNVDASGSSVQGNAPDANALGRAVGAAVQAELIKQKRPGGLLA